MGDTAKINFVGYTKPDKRGIFDLCGNASEWINELEIDAPWAKCDLYIFLASSWCYNVSEKTNLFGKQVVLTIVLGILDSVASKILMSKIPPSIFLRKAHHGNAKRQSL